MYVSVIDAKGQLTELVRRAEAGDEIILTRHGHPAVRLVPVKAARDKASRRSLLDAVRKAAAAKGQRGIARRRRWSRRHRLRRGRGQGAGIALQAGGPGAGSEGFQQACRIRLTDRRHLTISQTVHAPARHRSVDRPNGSSRPS
ncbi:MAG: type II toxin-antitoxin system prevent-host-death family antitoxin, partial [Microbacterium sp.]|nr:type II toxin-antitoxin system prevent-host-death family antitoxin [Microbacterium sp.]